MIKNLIFDFGKVLVDYDFAAFFRKYIPDPQRCKAFVPILYNEEVQRSMDREMIPFEEIIDNIVREHPEFEPEIQIFNQHYPEIITQEMPGMRELILQMKQEGYKIYGLSNWCSKVYLTMNQFEIFQLLDGYIISSEEHVIKPEPAIYQRLFDKFNLRPEECLFADDKEENIIGSRAMGMEGIVFQNAAQYAKEMRAIISAKK